MPPVGWQRTTEHDEQITVVCACENTGVIVRQPGQRTSMKYEFGDCTKRFSLCLRASSACEG